MRRVESLTTRRRAHVAAVVMRTRRQHAELRRGAITLDGLSVAVERHRLRVIRLHSLPLYELGSCLCLAGVGVISLDESLSDRAALLVLAHEFGHSQLGHATDPAIVAARSAEVDRIRAETGIAPFDDRVLPYGPVALACEAEADLFAALLLGTSLERYRAEMEQVIAAICGDALQPRQALGQRAS